MSCIVVIGTSRGGLEALRQLLPALPPSLPAPVLIVQHVGPYRSMLPALLSGFCTLPVQHAVDKAALAPGSVLVAPPDHHLIVEKDRVRLSRGPKEHHTRPAIDPLFRSAAAAHGEGVIGVILTGDLDDGTAGLQAIKARGGRTIVQNPAEAPAPDMPANALRGVEADLCLPLRAIGPAIVRLLQTDDPGVAADCGCRPVQPLRQEPGAAEGTLLPPH